MDAGFLDVVDDAVIDGGGGSGTTRTEDDIDAAAAEVAQAAASAPSATTTAGDISDVSVAGVGIPVVESVPRPPLAVGFGESPSLARFSASVMRHETCFAIVESVRFSSSILRSCVSPPDSSFVQQ